MAKHPLEKKYGLNAGELLDAIAGRMRLRVAVEGAVAEYHIDRQIAKLVGSCIDRYESHDLDNHPDFSIWLPGRAEPILAECKNVRESSKEGGEAYRVKGEVVAYKVETQKTRSSKSDPLSRQYSVDQFHILGVCLGKKTGDWSQVLYARTLDLARDPKHPHKLAVFQRVPLPGAEDIRPWYDDLGHLVAQFDAPPWR